MYRSLDNLTNLLINFSVTARAEKTWHGKCEMMYRMTYQVMKIHDYDSSLYPVITEDQFQVYSKKKSKGYLGLQI